MSWLSALAVVGAVLLYFSVVPWVASRLARTFRDNTEPRFSRSDRVAPEKRVPPRSPARKRRRAA